MSVLHVLKIGANAYNKAGYRLGQIVELSVPKYASDIGVTSIKKATIQHVSGEEKIVERWLDKNGKAIKTIHTSTANPNEKVVTTYNWSNPISYEEGNPYHEYLKKDNPYTFENITGKIKRRIMVKPQDRLLFEDKKVSYTNLDINKEHRTVTKSIGTIEDKYNTSEIYSINNGKKVKGLTLKAEKQEDGLYKTIHNDYFGISKEDAQKVFSDKYFHARFLPTLEMAKRCVAQAAKNQGVSFIPKIVHSPYDRVCALYKEKAIGLTNSMGDWHCGVIGTLEHESKHHKQHELVEKYLKGELIDSKEIELAKKYKYNFDNYLSPYVVGEDKYRTQLVEKEAFEQGSKARNLYFEVTDKLRELFNFSTFHSVGA